MKKLVITGLLLVFGFLYASAQSGSIDKPLTQEQRLVKSNAKHKNARKADVAKKVQRAKKQDRAARKKKAPKSRKTSKR